MYRDDNSPKNFPSIPDEALSLIANSIPNHPGAKLPPSATEFYKWLSSQSDSPQGTGFNFDLYGKFNPMFDGLDAAGASSLSNDLQLKKAQFDAQVAFFNWQTHYNSEAEKIRRMRSAGLNPDLLGLDSASTASGSLDSNLGGETASAIQSDAAVRQAAAAERQANLAAALAVPQMILSAVSSISGMVGVASSTSLNSAQKSLIDSQRDGISLDNFGKARGIAANKIIDTLSASIGVADDLSSLSDDKIDEAVKKASSTITGDSDLDRLIRREMKAIEKNPAVVRQYWSDYAESERQKTETAKQKASPYYSDSLADMVKMYKPVLQTAADTVLKEYDKQLEELDYQIDYFKSLSGSSAASAENALNEFNSNVYRGVETSLYTSSLNLGYREYIDALTYRRNNLSALRQVAQNCYDNLKSDSLLDNSLGVVFSVIQEVLFQTFGSSANSMLNIINTIPTPPSRP